MKPTEEIMVQLVISTRSRAKRIGIALVGSLLAAMVSWGPRVYGQSLADVIDQTQAKMVKVYGAGGLRGLEAYQSGFLISGDGWILTTWSYVLDADPVIVQLNDGSRHEAVLRGADPALEIALLKIEIEQSAAFALEGAIALQAGDGVLAFSNLYGVATSNEPVSVQRGVVTAVTRLAARKGSFPSPYQGPAYVLDAMTNNAGAAGGALTDRQGRLAGILGRELRDRSTSLWLNYAIPISELTASIGRIQEGLAPTTDSLPPDALPSKPWALASLGLRLIPNVLSVTPAYVDSVSPDSLASKAGLRRDDLITFVNDRLIRSQQDFSEALSRSPDHEPLSFVLLRDQELVTARIEPQP